jgi:hypothetical protein
MAAICKPLGFVVVAQNATLTAPRLQFAWLPANIDAQLIFRAFLVDALLERCLFS